MSLQLGLLMAYFVPLTYYLQIGPVKRVLIVEIEKRYMREGSILL